MPKPLTVAVAAVVVVALVAGRDLVGVRWWSETQRTDLEQAATYAPGDAQRLSWTDWAAVRDRVGARLDGASSGGDLQEFLDGGTTTTSRQRRRWWSRRRCCRHASGSLPRAPTGSSSASPTRGRW